MGKTQGVVNRLSKTKKPQQVNQGPSQRLSVTQFDRLGPISKPSRLTAEIHQIRQLRRMIALNEIALADPSPWIAMQSVRPQWRLSEGRGALRWNR